MRGVKTLISLQSASMPDAKAVKCEKNSTAQAILPCARRFENPDPNFKNRSTLIHKSVVTDYRTPNLWDRLDCSGVHHSAGS
jgi:hypothetical protein